MPLDTVPRAMLGDPWPEEPPDPFPEYHEPDPEPELPVADATPESPSTSDAASRATTESTAARRLTAGFWALAPLFQVGPFAVALGLLLVVVRGARLYGSAIVAIGVVTCVYGGYRYLVYRSLARRLQPAEGERADDRDGQR